MFKIMGTVPIPKRKALSRAASKQHETPYAGEIADIQTRAMSCLPRITKIQYIPCGILKTAVNLTAVFSKSRRMNKSITLYNSIRRVVQTLFSVRPLLEGRPGKGRPALIPYLDCIAIGIYKQAAQIATKKAVFRLLEPRCSYKTFVVSINRWARMAGHILVSLLQRNRKRAHLVKHIDSTDIPVCAPRKGARHKTMAPFSSWGKTGKGWFYGLKLHLVSDLKRRILNLTFTAGNADDRSVVMSMTRNMNGIFVADTGYVSARLEPEFGKGGKRVLLVKPRKNMKKLMAGWQYAAYRTRTLIEVNFGILKSLYGLVTSFPRSVSGYLAHYLYALLAYCIA